MGKRLEQFLARRRARTGTPARKSRLMLILIIVGFAAVAVWIWYQNRPPSKGPFDVNEATAEELDRLPEVGPEMARAIIDGRPYEEPEDLLDVKGIGPKTLEKLKPHLVFP